MPIEALTSAAQEWAISPLSEGVGSIDGAGAGAGGLDNLGGLGGDAGSGGGFGGVLSKQLQSLESLQNDAAKASRSLADGTATDPSQVVVAVERAQLAMQLAAQLRTKAVDAVSEVMRTQV